MLRKQKKKRSPLYNKGVLAAIFTAALGTAGASVIISTKTHNRDQETMKIQQMENNFQMDRIKTLLQQRNAANDAAQQLLKEKMEREGTGGQGIQSLIEQLHNQLRSNTEGTSIQPDAGSPTATEESPNRENRFILTPSDRAGGVAL